jgi:hypothetical protein
MPEKKTVAKARKAKRAGKAASTQAGEFIRNEVRKIRRGRHGARSTRQIVAIGHSKARRAGVALPPPGRRKARASTRKSAQNAYSAGQGKRTTRRRPGASRAATRALKKEPRRTASRSALSRQASQSRAASRRTARDRSEAARKAARTKGAAGRSAAARKAARTRARNRRLAAS